MWTNVKHKRLLANIAKWFEFLKYCLQKILVHSLLITFIIILFVFKILIIVILLKMFAIGFL